MENKIKLTDILNRMADELDALTVSGVRNCHLVSLIAGNVQLLREIAEKTEKSCDEEVENGGDENTDD